MGTVFSIQCSYGSWFGESDDRFYIDGEAEPSIVGTGCEDFFNDAWNLRLFTNANTGVTIKEPNGEDCRFTAYRWHVQAPVTFRKSLKVEIERRSYALVTNPRDRRARALRFQVPARLLLVGGVLVSEDDRRAVSTAFPPVEERINPEIFLETADMAAEIKTSPGVTARRHSNRVCNLKRALYVDNPRVGGWFEVPCRVDEEGKYSISVFQCLYRTGGIWKVTLRGPGRRDPARSGHGLLRSLPGLEGEPAGELPLRHVVREQGGDPQADARRLRVSLRVRRLPSARPSGGLRRARPELPAGRHLVAPVSLGRSLRTDAALPGRGEEAFAGMVAQAKETVASLDAAVRRFHQDTGEYPASLEELLKRPRRFRPAAGLAVRRQFPADPWGQAYRYEQPGREFNPDAFDVYSVHGNSRNPAGWIGNWPRPFRIENALEGEELEIHARSDDVTVSKQAVGIASFPRLCPGRLLFIRLEKKATRSSGASTSAAPGRCVKVRLVTSWDYAVVRLGSTDVPSGQPVDTYTPKIDAKWAVLGEVEVRSSRSEHTPPRSSGPQPCLELHAMHQCYSDLVRWHEIA